MNGWINEKMSEGKSKCLWERGWQLKNFSESKKIYIYFK